MSQLTFKNKEEFGEWLKTTENQRILAACICGTLKFDEEGRPILPPPPNPECVFNPESNLGQLRERMKKLDRLLCENEVGLATWHETVHAQMDELITWWKEE